MTVKKPPRSKDSGRVRPTRGVVRGRHKKRSGSGVDELIQKRRAEASLEAAKEDKNSLERGFEALVGAMQDPESSKAFDAMLKATPAELGKAAAEYRKHEKDMYRVMKESQSGALRAVLKIMDAWELSEKERLSILGCNRTMYGYWVKDTGLTIMSGHTLLRMSYVLGIWKALSTLFPDPEIARTWIHRSNSAQPFNGTTPLSVMVQGTISNLQLVQKFLKG